MRERARILRSMKHATANRIQAMMLGAESKITSRNRYATFDDGIFQVYVTPVEQRTRAMKEHFRVGYYMLVDGVWRRTSKARFIEAMDAEAQHAAA